MTIALRGNKLLSGWASSPGQPVGFFLDAIFYDENETKKLRDYLNEKFPVDTAE